jgi:hypothetical protein
MKVLENVLALTDVISIELDELCKKEFLSATERDKLKELKIKHKTIKQIMGVEKLW